MFNYKYLVSIIFLYTIFIITDAGAVNKNQSSASQTNTLSQFGITWTFDKAYETGQFVNGDNWVVGPVKVINIDPKTTSNPTLHGSMINPVVSSNQGYDSRLVATNFVASLNIASGISGSSPLTLNPGTSLVSTIGKASTARRPYVKTAAILTVLDQSAPQGSFRPPFSGSDKTIRYNKSQLDYSRLPKLTPMGNPPALSTVTRYFERPWLDHAGDGPDHQYMVPDENMRNYGRDIAAEVELGALSLLLDYSDAEKEELLINFIQVGIDLHGVVAYGGGQNRWVPGGGHNSGRKWPIVFAGIMLDDANMANVQAAFQEDGQTYYGNGWTGATALWGTRHSILPEMDHEHKHPSNWTKSGNSDNNSEGYRQCCSGVSWVGMALAARLMGAKDIWNHPPFFDYVDRWFEEDWTDFYNIVVTQGGGETGNLQGGTSHSFIKAMWDAYRHTVGSSELTITTTQLTDADEGINYNTALQVVNGTSPYSWNITSGALPAGLSLSSAGVINGSTTQTGNFTFEVQVTDNDNNTDTQSLSLQVHSDTAPELLQVGIINVTTVEVTFSEAMDQASAENTGNYVISPAVSIFQAVLTTPTTVTLSTASHTLGDSYQLCVSSVMDDGPNKKPVAQNSCDNYTVVNNIELEAEGGELASPMSASNDVNASGGAYISTSSTNLGLATYQFNIFQAGTYAFTARVIAPSAATNSFFFTLDGNPQQIWDIVSTPNNWTELGLSVRGNGTPEDPEFDTLKVDLQPGIHTFIIAGRESGAKLDKINITLSTSQEVDPPADHPWYVDNAASGANNGTSWSNAWQNFANINWSSVQPGDTVYISGGSSSKSYFETLTISKAGTANSRVIIKTGQDAGHTGKVIIDGQFARSNNINFTSSAGYVSIDGSRNGQINMVIQHSQNDGIFDKSANHIELAYLEIQNNGNNGSGDGYDVDVSTAPGGNKIHHCSIHDNYQDQIRGYIQASAPGFSYYDIYENDIYNIHDDGIEMNAGGLVIRDNRIHTRTSGDGDGHPDGIQIEGAEYLKIYNNEIYDLSTSDKGDFSSNALLFVDPVGNSGNRHAHDIYIYNNLLYETYAPFTDVLVRGISFKLESNMESAADIYIVNNTIVDVPFWGMSVTFNFKSNVQNVFVENNILYNAAQIADKNLFFIGRSGGGGFSIGSHGEGKDVTFDYNLINPGQAGNTNISFHGTKYSYAAFKTQFGVQQNEVTTAPEFMFYQPNDVLNDYHLKATDTSAKNQGVALSKTFLAEDKDGTARPHGLSWDIGAFENSSSVLFITTSELPDANEGVNYNTVLEAINGVASYSWNIITGTLPAGLNLSNAGTISGSPTLTGDFVFEVQVTDQADKTDTQSFALHVNSDPVPELLQVKLVNLNTLEVTFSEAMEQTSAENTDNYAISPTVSILQAVLTTPTMVTLSTASHPLGETYQLCIDDVTDNGPNKKVITPNSCNNYSVANDDSDLELEAENGELISPMSAVDDIDASGGTYISTSVANQGLATYRFNISQSGTYIFTARVIAPSSAANSFYFTLDADAQQTWDIVSTSSSWNWVGLSVRGTGTPTNPEIDTLSVHLEPGEHVLQIKGREKGTKLDKINIALQGEENPICIPIPLPSLEALGRIKRGDQSHVKEVCFSFEGTPGDVGLMYQVYDIDTPEKVYIILNGIKLPNAKMTNNLKWSRTRALLLNDAM